MDGPIRPEAGVAFSGGHILSIGSAAELRWRYPQALVEELGDMVLMPGLVNAHVHLELSALTPGNRPADFVEWLKRLLPRSAPTADAVRAFTVGGVETGVDQCLRFGVTCVGDISRQCSITRPLLAAGPLRVVSYGEVQAMARRRGFLEERLAIAADASLSSDRLRIGVSPHAPYSIDADGYSRCLQVARERGMPLATHLAETTAEGEFLADHRGPFRDLWDYLDAWDDLTPTFHGGAIRFARSLGLLAYPTLLAHVNYCDDEEMAMLACGRASVVYCPRTHAYFGHAPHRWRRMLEAGINVAVGTDSTASSPNLNLVDDLRLLHDLAPDMPAGALWELATVRAARALEMESRIGSLTPGKAADFVAFSTRGNEPMREILESDSLPSNRWIGGQKLDAITGSSLPHGRLEFF
ncbi:MAG TPA: amidohydrolase family protein [Tepidisphaeraceae bacterium]|jgi:cytosine/adenosine deaminase-related metal-dependent hydrolase|nr:amidohydrolase family protein [Tepidisphaeraceae bacterium]